MRDRTPTVLTPTAWRPSPQLLDALADCLLAVAEQRHAARLAHAAGTPGQPDIAVIRDDTGFRREEEER